MNDYSFLSILLRDPRYSTGTITIRCNANGRFSVTVKLDEERICHKDGFLSIGDCLAAAEIAAAELLRE